MSDDTRSILRRKAIQKGGAQPECDLDRQTGRTTRMLIEALQIADTAEKPLGVEVKVATGNSAPQIREMFMALALTRAYEIVSARRMEVTVKGASGQPVTYTFDPWPDRPGRRYYRTFIDHYAMEADR